MNSQLSELGLSWTQCAWINSVSALVSMAGPLCLGPLAHKLSGYKQGLVASLLLAFISCTALLFVPSVISSEHTPKMYFDCSEGVFRVEQCPNWNGQCHIYPKRPATNFSSFELVTCSYVCPDDKTPVNSSWYPINVCFHNTNEHISNLCLGRFSFVCFVLSVNHKSLFLCFIFRCTTRENHISRCIIKSRS